MLENLKIQKSHVKIDFDKWKDEDEVDVSAIKKERKRMVFNALPIRRRRTLTLEEWMVS